MKMNHSKNCVLATLCLLATILTPHAQAQITSTWTGAGADDNWSTIGNWDVPPIVGDSLVFAGNARLINTNDIVDMTTNGWLRFDAGGFALNGNPLFLTQGITNNAGTNTIAMNLNWGALVGQNVFVAPDSELVIAGTLTNTLVNHTNTGGGRVRLTGTYLQTNNPPASILNNVEYIVDGGRYTNGGGVRITSGTNAGASKLVLTNGAVMHQTITGGAIRVGDTASLLGELIIDNSTLIHNGGNIAIGFVASAIGAVKQTGGVVTNADIVFCNGATTIATYDMVGGTLAPIRIRKSQATGTATMTFDGSTLRPGTNVNTTFFTGLNTAEIKAGGLTINSSGENFTVGQSFSGVGRLTKTGGGTVTFTGSSLNDGLTVNQGTVTLNSTNTFTNVIVSAGTLQIANEAAVGGPLALNGGTIRNNNSTLKTIAAPLTFGGNFTIGANGDLNFTGNIALTGSRTLTVNNTNTFSGTISESGGSYSITKAGTGILQLPVNNNYSGDTLVTAGTLRVTNPTGSATGSGTVVVSGTGTLSGTGQVGAISVNTGGTVAPGTGVGILAVTNSASFGEAGVYQLEMSDANTALPPGTGVDFLNIPGALDITATSGSPFVIDLSSMGGLAANFDNTQSNSWIIATAGGITGFAANKFVVSTANFQNDLGTNAFSVSLSGNNLLLTLSAAPTPQPTIDSNIVGAGTTNAQISFSTVSGADYTVQYKTNLNQIGWLDLTNFTATGSSSTVTDNTDPVPTERYYQVVSP